MGSNNEQLQPKHIDDQIEKLLQQTPENTQVDNPASQLAKSLQSYYTQEKQKAALERAWQAISQTYEDETLVSIGIKNSPEERKKVGQYRMRHQPNELQPTRKTFPRWGSMLLVAVIILAIGATAVIMSQGKSQQATFNSATGIGGNVVRKCITPTAINPHKATAVVSRSSSEKSSGTAPSTTKTSCIHKVPTPTPISPFPKPTRSIPTPTPIPFPTPTQSIPTPTPISPYPTIPTPTPIPFPIPTPTPIH